MGLDNGVVARTKDKQSRSKTPFWIKEPFDDKDEVDLCYWRKWWPLRNTILWNIYTLEKDEEYEYRLSKEDLKYIRKIVLSYTFSKKRFTDLCGGYWDWNHWQIKRGIHELINLTWAIRNYDKYDFIFYDSY